MSRSKRTLPTPKQSRRWSKGRRDLRPPRRACEQCRHGHSENVLTLREGLEAEPFQGRGLRVADRGLDLPLPIGIAPPTRQGDGFVVREHVAVQPVQDRVVDIRGEHAFAQVVEDDEPDVAAQPTEGLLMQLDFRLDASDDGRDSRGRANFM